MHHCTTQTILFANTEIMKKEIYAQVQKFHTSLPAL